MNYNSKFLPKKWGFIISALLLVIIAASIHWLPDETPRVEDDQESHREPFDLAPPPILELDEGVLTKLQAVSGHDIGYIANDYHNAVYIVDLTSQEYLGRLNFIAEEPRGGPSSIALTPDGEYFIVTRGK